MANLASKPWVYTEDATFTLAHKTHCPQLPIPPLSHLSLNIRKDRKFYSSFPSEETGAVLWAELHPPKLMCGSLTPPSSSECDSIGDSVIKEVIRLKWGH